MDLSLFSFLVYILLTIHNLSVPEPNNEVDIFFLLHGQYAIWMDVITISPQSEMMKTILDIINIMEYKFGK